MPALTPGKYNLSEVSLFSEITGMRISLISMAAIVEINIFESVFTESLSGNIVIVDNRNIIANFPIVGNEKIQILLSTETNEENNEDVLFATFKVYAISSHKKENVGTNAYILNFTSEEYIKSCHTVISKSYSEMVVSEIAKRVYAYLGSDKKLEVEETKYLQSLIIPNWKPFRAMNWLASRAQSGEYNGANYLFYETLDGFNFKSLESCMDVEDDEVYGTYSNIPPRLSMNFEDDYFLIRELRIKKNHNVVENQLAGMYSSRLIVHDIIKRTTKNVDFNYRDSYSDHIHSELNKRPGGQISTMLLSEDIGDEYIDYSATPESHFEILPVHSNLFSGNAKEYGTNREGIIQTRKSQMRQLQNLELQVVIEGDLKIRVGYIISLKIPSNQPSDGAWTWDPYLSGRYVITSIKHAMTNTVHNTILTLNKDSYSVPIDKNSDLMENINRGVQ